MSTTVSSQLGPHILRNSFSFSPRLRNICIFWGFFKSKCQL